MVFIHHVLLLLLHVLFSHPGTGVIAQRSRIVAQGDDVVLPERCPDIAEDGASSLTAEVVNEESNLTDTEVIRRNAQVFTSSPEILVTGPECPSHLPNKPIAAEDAGLYCCRDGTNNRIHVSVLSRGSIQRSSVTPTISFGCVLVTAKGQGACVDPTVSLRWVDVEDNEIQEGVLRRGSCETRLTVQNDDSRVFLCQAYSGTEVKATLSFPMRPPGPGKGRRGFLVPDPDYESGSDSGAEVDPQSQGGSGGVAVVLVGVVSCVALTALLTLFVVNRRRSSKPLPANSDHINHDICSSDDVVYADLDLPVSSGVSIMPKQEVSEYASIKTHMYDQ